MGNCPSDQIEGFGGRGQRKKIRHLNNQLRECQGKVKTATNSIHSLYTENQKLTQKLDDASRSIYNLVMNLEACKKECPDFTPRPYNVPS